MRAGKQHAAQHPHLPAAWHTLTGVPPSPNTPPTARHALTASPPHLQVEAPPELQGNRVFQRLRAHVKAQTDAHHSVPSRSASEAPKEWVRGWSDSGADLSSGSSSGGGGSGAKPV